MKTIIVATDLSEESKPAVRAAKELASAQEARLLLTHVFDPMPMVPPTALAPGYTLGDSVIREIRTSIEKSLKELSEGELAGTNTEVCLIESSSPANEIVALAEKENADLIVIGTHGRTGAKRFLMGSVAERVVRLANRDVYVAN